MNELEELTIYKQYYELIFYTLEILKKYPKSERYSTVNEIKVSTYEGFNNIIMAYKEYDKKMKIKYLNKLDANLKLLQVLIRISKKQKFISPKNYTAWSKKIANIRNLLLGCFKSCARQ